MLGVSGLTSGSSLCVCKGLSTRVDSVSLNAARFWATASSAEVPVLGFWQEGFVLGILIETNGVCRRCFVSSVCYRRV